MNNKILTVFARAEFIIVLFSAAVLLAVTRILFDIPTQIIVLGVLIAVSIGTVIGFLAVQADREKRIEELLEKLQVSVSLSSESMLFEQQSKIAESFTRLAKLHHPVLRDFAHYTIAQFTQRIDRISLGILEFNETESWRASYAELLNNPEVRRYRSVALIRQPEYWRDDAGEVSVRENLKLIRKGKSIERIAILGDRVWPLNTPLMETDIGKWLKHQADGSIKVFVVRDSSLASDPDLLVDFGIYGEDVVGIQELDENARTRKFTFFFDETEKRFAEQRWKRLLAYSKPLEELIEQRN